MVKLGAKLHLRRLSSLRQGAMKAVYRFLISVVCQPLIYELLKDLSE